jgi:hypothetical protein
MTKNVDEAAGIECLVDKSLLKDSIGRYMTGALVREQYQPNHVKFKPIFTIKDYDHDGLISMKRVYMEEADPTEYRPAMKLFGDWGHWQKFLTLEWFKPIVESWREELEIKLRSDAIKGIVSMSKQENPTGLNAMKFLANKEYVPDEKKRGRPSKKEIARNMKIQQGIKNETEEDMKRLGLIN